MTLQNVPLFGTGVQGRSPNVSAQSRVNLYVEMPSDPEANGIVMFPTPGKSTFVNFGANPSRGAYVKDSLAFFVNGNQLIEVAANGTQTVRGTLNTSGGRVDITDNGNTMLIVDGTTTGYLYTFSNTTLATQALPAALETCTFMNGYFVGQEANSGRFWISGAYSGTSWNSLDFATAEADPDNLVRLISDSGMLILFGSKTTEFWGDSGAADFPFARIGASAIEWGLASRWSLCKFDGSLMFLRRNRLAAVQVCQLMGNQAIPVSTPEMDYLLSTYTVDNATAYSYMVSGHPMYQINFPANNISWVYDGLSKEWHQARFGASGRDRGEIQVNFLNKSYVTDYDNGKVYLIDQTVYTDDGQYIVREFVARHNKTGALTKIPRLWLEMEAGVGLFSGQGSNPQIMLQTSKNGGHTWGPILQAAIGAIGAYRIRAQWTKLGVARDWLMKFRVTDPVKTVFVAAWAQVNE